MSESVFIAALAIAAITVCVVARSIAGAIKGRGASGSEIADLKERLDEAQSSLQQQSTQLAELQERVDFAERLLAKSRDRSALGAGEKRE
jgi:hypothetical protein